ncbi:MAG TPA: hypothetical protein VMS60_12300 [Solirubrobacterales bacterium]|nr:hypothetical protein [Solirubrobacterales bacterium]
MSAVARYMLVEHLGSRRWVAPFLFLASGVIVLYAQPPNPVLSTAGTAAAWMFPAQAWWAFAFLNTQEPGERQTLVATVGARRFAAGRLLGLLALLAIAMVFTAAFPILTGRFERPAHLDEIVLILCANWLCGAAGSGLAALVCEPIVRTRAVPVLFLTGAVVLSIPLDVSPAIETAAAMNRTDASAVPGQLAPETLGIALFLALALPLGARLWRLRE